MHTNVNVDFFCSHGYMNEMSKMKQTLEKETQTLISIFLLVLILTKILMWKDMYIFLLQNKIQKRTYIGSTPKNSENVFNIDISKLFFPKRGEFDQEYAKIVNFFNFTPRFSSVKKFYITAIR